MSVNIKNTAQHVLSVIICLYVIMSINIKNTPQHVLSVIICLCVIMSINIKNTAHHVLSVILCHSVILSISIKFPFSMHASFVSVTCMKSAGCNQRWRRALSSIKKGVFLDVEGHVLEWRRACSWNEWGWNEGSDGCWVLGVRCWWLAKDGCNALWNRLT